MKYNQQQNSSTLKKQSRNDYNKLLFQNTRDYVLLPEKRSFYNRVDQLQGMSNRISELIHFVDHPKVSKHQYRYSNTYRNQSSLQHQSEKKQKQQKLINSNIETQGEKSTNVNSEPLSQIRIKSNHISTIKKPFSKYIKNHRPGSRNKSKNYFETPKTQTKRNSPSQKNQRSSSQSPYKMLQNSMISSPVNQNPVSSSLNDQKNINETRQIQIYTVNQQTSYYQSNSLKEFLQKKQEVLSNKISKNKKKFTYLDLSDQQIPTQSQQSKTEFLSPKGSINKPSPSLRLKDYNSQQSKTQKVDQKNISTIESQMKAQNRLNSIIQLDLSLINQNSQSQNNTPTIKYHQQLKEAEIKMTQKPFSLKVYPCDIDAKNIRNYLADKLVEQLVLDLQIERLKANILKICVRQYLNSQNKQESIKKLPFLQILFKQMSTKNYHTDNHNISNLTEIIGIDSGDIRKIASQIKGIPNQFPNREQVAMDYVQKLQRAFQNWEYTLSKLIQFDILQKTNFRPEQIDLQGRGYLKIQDFTCLINLNKTHKYTQKPYFSNIEVWVLYRRFLKRQKDYYYGNNVRGTAKFHERQDTLYNKHKQMEDNMGICYGCFMDKILD